MQNFIQHFFFAVIEVLKRKKKNAHISFIIQNIMISCARIEYAYRNIFWKFEYTMCNFEVKKAPQRREKMLIAQNKRTLIHISTHTTYRIYWGHRLYAVQLYIKYNDRSIIFCDYWVIIIYYYLFWIVVHSSVAIAPIALPMHHTYRWRRQRSITFNYLLCEHYNWHNEIIFN